MGNMWACSTLIKHPFKEQVQLLSLKELRSPSFGNSDLQLSSIWMIHERF